MAVADASQPSGRTNWLYDARVRAVLYQIITVVLFVAFVGWLTGNTMQNLEQRGIATGFKFLDQPTGFGLPFHLIEYTETSTYETAFYVSVLNTIFVSFIGIILATVIGFLMGVMRLSRNWLISRLAAVYLESARNVPLLLQILFWYFGVLNLLPVVANSIPIGNSVFISNRGIFMPRIVPEEGFAVVPIAFLVGILCAIGFSIWARRQQAATGRQFPTFWIGLGAIIGLPVIAALGSGLPWTIVDPEWKTFGFRGGWNIVPEFIALLLALVIYTAAFIGELVRAGILAVSHGQTEASYALGLKPGPTLRLVVIPQAMRVIIPPLTSQYLNLTKNSSLAAAIGYPELTAVFAGTVLNQTGQAIECIAMVMLVYFTISLVISIFMNWYNKRIALVER